MSIGTAAPLTNGHDRASPAAVNESGHGNPGPSGTLELWGGVECTVNRVGDRYFDQLERSGHAARPGDIAAFAGLGIRAIRYPVLWERVAPHGLESADWSWPDERLHRLRELDVRVVAGLTHHGSGPRDTSLVDPTFATGLAAYARQVALRYPWIDAYTPVNEPLTTARFSGLYGLWYPHGRDDATFARALLNQCRAVCLAMSAVREVNPRARLVQTEDLGRTYCSPPLEAMARFYNERRWLSLDLLCGRVTPDHELYGALLEWGIGADELAWHASHPCPPDLVGVNHYACSDRYLDDAVDRHEGRLCGVTPDGVPFVDIEAVRGCVDDPIDAASVLEEVWTRYRLPLAITETHLGATREEQLRWLKQTWDGAAALRARGVDVRAVTVWSLLGSFDWDVLVTAQSGCYEPGPLDVRGPHPRCTALGQLMRDLASGRPRDDDPLLTLPGWWQRPERLHRPELRGLVRLPSEAALTADARAGGRRSLLVVGADSALGAALSRACEIRGIPHHALPSLQGVGASELDQLVSWHQPWAVVDASVFADPDGDDDVAGEACMLRNVEMSGALARVCRRHDARLVCISSDLVFDGQRTAPLRPYVESDEVTPLSVHGRITAEMEASVLDVWPHALVVRSGPLIDASDSRNFVSDVVSSLERYRPVCAATDEIVSPTSMRSFVDATLDLLIDGEAGIWHLANAGSLSWFGLATRVAELAGLPTALVEPVLASDVDHATRRPRYAAIGSERGALMPSLDRSLEQWVREVSGRAGDRIRSCEPCAVGNPPRSVPTW